MLYNTLNHDRHRLSFYFDILIKLYPYLKKQGPDSENQFLTSPWHLALWARILARQAVTTCRNLLAGKSEGIGTQIWVLWLSSKIEQTRCCEAQANHEDSMFVTSAAHDLFKTIFATTKLPVLHQLMCNSTMIQKVNRARLFNWSSRFCDHYEEYTCSVSNFYTLSHLELEWVVKTHDSEESIQGFGHWLWCWKCYKGSIKVFTLSS